jgi:hypothetical protein
MENVGIQLAWSNEIDGLEDKLDQKLIEIKRLKDELKSAKESLRKQNDRLDFDLLSSPINKIIHDTEVTIIIAKRFR